MKNILKSFPHGQHSLTYSVPKNWRVVNLEEVLEKIVGGGTPSKANPSYWEGSIPWLTVKDMRTHRPNDAIDHISGEAVRQSATNLIPPDTIIIATRIGLGKVIRVPFETAINQDLKALITKPEIDKGYLEYWLISIAAYLESIGSGTTVKGIRLELLRTLPFPLAPSNLQKRIVEEIEKQFSRLDEAVASLKRAKANLKRYKESVLKAAVEGKLTEEWRKTHPNVEPASQLLKRLLADRRKNWSGGSAYKEPTLPNKTDLPILPKSWTWASPEFLATDASNSICAGPFGTIFKASDFRTKGIPIIFLRHVSPGNYLTHKPGFMDEEKWKELFQPYSVFGGELLITKLGEPPGICATYPFGIGPAMVTPDVMKMSVDPNSAESFFLMSYFNSQIAQAITSKLAFGTTRLRLTLQLFRTIPVPLPPLAEQKIIVEKLIEMFSTIDDQERSVDANIDRANRIRQSILKQAFSGKLVPNDSNDESASSLLENIKYLGEMGRNTSKKQKKQKSKDGSAAMKIEKKRALLDVLREHSTGISPESLLANANFSLEDVENFYFELSSISDQLEEIKPAGDDALRWPHKVQFLLRLRK